MATRGDGAVAVAASGCGGRAERLARLTPLVVVAYFAVNALARALTPGSLGLDEAQIMVHAQSLEWGYGLQPPLYAWLQHAAFALAGEGKATLAGVKYGLLAVAFVGVWATARLAGAGPLAAAAATLLLMFVPGIAWEAQRALTHTPLALALAAWAFAAFAWASQRGGLAAYLVLGLVLGAGVLAKWNGVFVLLGVLGAVLLGPLRRWRGGALAAAVAAATVAPTAVWYFADWGEASRAFGAIDNAERAAWTAAPAVVLGFAEGVAATLGLVALASALMLFRPPACPATSAVDPAVRRGLTWAAAVTTAAVLVTALLNGTTEIKERWLTPVLVAVPLVVVLWAPLRVTAPRLGRLATVVAGLALAITLGLQWNWRLGDGEPPPQTAPFGPIATQIGATGDAVLAADHWIGGNLRLHAPELAVLTPATPKLGLDVAPPVQLVWRAEEGASPPVALRALFRERFGHPPRLGSSERLAAPYPAPHANAPPLELRRALAW
jgi:4-amino-4-deoxy-L-arabinose transferase-like glycosyltransferase